MKLRRSLWLCAALMGAAGSLPSLGKTYETGLTVDCKASIVRFEPPGGAAGEEYFVSVVLVKYPESDPACAVGSRVERVQRKIELATGRRSFSLSLLELGLIPPPGCRSYVVSALVLGPRGDAPINVSCTPRAATEGTDSLDCTQPSIAAQIRDDLLLGNEIDLGALGGGTCIGTAEYAAQVHHEGVHSNTYGVTLHAKYVCAPVPHLPAGCEPNGLPPGVGENKGDHSTSLGPGGCLSIKYLNDAGSAPLPRCCDLIGPNGVAVQCTSFTVTAVNGEPCSTPFQSLQTIHMDGGTAGFGCNFDPGNASTTAGSLCETDGDGDGIVEPQISCSSQAGCCDNCLGTYNPGQTDADADGYGDSCDNCPGLYNPDEQNTPAADHVTGPGVIWSGSYLDAACSDNALEDLKEGTVGGKARLTHVWKFTAVPAGTHSLLIEGYRTGNTPGESFQFYRNFTGSGFFLTISGAVISQTFETTQTVPMNLTTTQPGDIYIQVKDLVTTDTQIDHLFIDRLAIVTEPPE